MRKRLNSQMKCEEQPMAKESTVMKIYKTKGDCVLENE